MFWIVENPAISGKGQRAGTVILLLVAAGSVFLIRGLSREYFASLLRGAAAAPRRFVHWLLLPETRRGPFGMAVWAWVVCLVLLLPPTGQGRFLVAFAVFLVYTILALVALVTLPGWWRRALLTLVLGPVVMGGLIIEAEAFQKNVIGEGGLAFLGPLMWSWAGVPATGLLRLLFARTSSPPTDRPTPAT